MRFVYNRRVMKDLYKGDYMNRKETYKIYYNIGSIYMQLGGKVESAYKNMIQALQAANLSYGRNSVESSAAYLAIGKIYKGENDMCNALNHFKVAEEILSNKEDSEMFREVEKEIKGIERMHIDK